MTGKAKRLGPEDWLQAGLEALADHGPLALKAEHLARAMGTTKGSFYWHFKDLDDYQRRLAQHWARIARHAVISARTADLKPAEKLQSLAGLFHVAPETGGGARLEPAIRAWARSDATVSDVVAEIDRARLGHIADVLRGLGLSNPDFPRLVYGAYVGMGLLPGTVAENDGALSSLAAALLALQDA